MPIRPIIQSHKTKNTVKNITKVPMIGTYELWIQNLIRCYSLLLEGKGGRPVLRLTFILLFG